MQTGCHADSGCAEIAGFAVAEIAEVLWISEVSRLFFNQFSVNAENPAVDGNVWLASFLGGLPIGWALLRWAISLQQRERKLLGMPALPIPDRRQNLLLILGIAALFCGILTAESQFHSLDTPEVQPSAQGRQARLIYHGCLIGLLVVATLVDFDCFMIPDDITIPGFLMGVIGAVAIGEAQICHLWVDWWQEIPGICGPYIPEWFDLHRHWHGLAWSLTGAIVGGGITWGVRILSGWLLKEEALGFGDVTLMTMIGSFLGWQPVLCVFVVAPLAGLLLMPAALLIFRAKIVPYGPSLSAGAVLVLLNWSWLWPRTRLVFGDWPSLLTLATIATTGLTGLLWMIGRPKKVR